MSLGLRADPGLAASIDTKTTAFLSSSRFTSNRLPCSTTQVCSTFKRDQQLSYNFEESAASTYKILKNPKETIDNVIVAYLVQDPKREGRLVRHRTINVGRCSQGRGHRQVSKGHRQVRRQVRYYMRT
jgi:hypothetical protein